MIEERFLQFLEHLPDGTSELYCHPATQRWDGPDNLPSEYRPLDEFAALLSPAVKKKLEDIRLQPISFRAALT
jgi:hypothetical protein